MCILRNLVFGLVACLLVAVSIEAAPVHFVSELGEDVDVEELESKFVRAMQEMGSTCDASDVNIKAIDYGHYKYLSSLINHFTERPLKGSVTILPSDFDDTKWKLRFADENMDIVSLAIDGKPERLVIEGDAVGSKGDSQKQLWLRAAGEYNLSLPMGFVPSAFKIEAVNLETGETEEIIGDWPKQGRYCLIKITDNCIDDTQELRDILEDEDKIGEPLRLSDVQEPVQLFHAAIGDTQGKLGVAWDEKTLRMTISKPQGRNPTRVWMMFPITLDESNARLETLKNDDGTFKKGEEVAAIIQDQGVIKFDLSPGVQPLYEVEKGKNGWYEMPENGVGNQEVYEAIWQFDDPNDPHWNGKDHRLYVFEFQYDNGDTEIVSVTHPVSDKKTRAVDEELNVFNYR